MKLKELKKGDYFTLKATDEPLATQVWVKGEYDRSDQKYYCTNWSDYDRERAFKGDREVYTDFVF